MIRDKNIDELKSIMGKSLLQPSDIDFENKIMQNILLANIKKAAINKNLQLSWIFLIISIIVFPLSYVLIFNNINLDIFNNFGIELKEVSQILYPAGIILFSIVVLLQVDNLLRLSVKQKLV